MTEKKRETDLRGHSGDNVPFDLSQMSLLDRAKLASLIERDGDSDLRQHLLGAMGRSERTRGVRRSSREVPDMWNLIFVLDRLEEAAKVMAMMPAATRPKAYGSAWPAVVQEKIPLVVLAEMSASGELEAQETDRNRVRLPPTAAELSRAEEAQRWPILYLADQPDLARAVNLRSYWAAFGFDIRKRCQRRGLEHDEFYRQWQEGLTIITQQLIRRKVPVS